MFPVRGRCVRHRKQYGSNVYARTYSDARTHSDARTDVDADIDSDIDSDVYTNANFYAHSCTGYRASCDLRCRADNGEGGRHCFVQ